MAPVRRRFGARRDLDPDGGVVHAAHAKEVVVDGALGCQAVEEGRPGERVGEALGRERRDVGVGRVGGVAEDRLQIGVCRQRRPACVIVGSGEQSYEDAFAYGFEEMGERVGALVARRRLCGSWAQWPMII